MKRGDFKICVWGRHGEIRQESVPGYGFNYKGIELFAHKFDGDKWRVSEARTGLAVTPVCQTRKHAIEEAISRIEKKGIEKTKQIIEEQIEFLKERVK